MNATNNVIKTLKDYFMAPRIRVITLATLTVLAVSGCAATAQQDQSNSAQSQAQIAQSQPSSSEQVPSRGNGQLDSSDRSFLTKSAQGSTLEFATSQLAIQKAQSPQVVQYALQLLQDHADYNRRLTLLARKKGITLPVTLDQQGQSKLNQLSRLQGRTFDQAYIRESVQANTEDVNDLQRQTQMAQDQDVKTFANGVLPTQRNHKQAAISLSGSNQTSQTNR
jgi:putative membrane protein